MKRTSQLISFLMLMSQVCFLQAQPAARLEDHFYRKFVMNRIDLQEKINKPLIYIPNIQSPNQAGTYQGIVRSLLTGLEQGEYVAYNPDNLSQVLNAQEVLSRFLEFENGLTGNFEGDYESDFPDFPEYPVEEDSNIASQQSGQQQSFSDVDLGNCESVLQFAEQRIFDKVQGEMVYKIDHFQLIWVDPTGSLPEKVLACFRYPDVQTRLESTPWVNRFNDAETRNIREAFELRMFHSYVINLGGEGVRSLGEAEYRRLQLVEYEHHLWNY